MSPSPDTRLAFAVPGGFERLTGGTIYDRRLALGLEALAWRVERIDLPASFPEPAPADVAATRDRLLALPRGSRLVVDGLALGVLPELAAELARHLELTALVHHPLAFETGLPPVRVDELMASETAALAPAARVLCTSETTRFALVDRFGVPPERITVAIPGTDPRPLAWGSGGAGLHLLNLGSVVPRKDQRTLVEALAAIPDRRATLTIAGSLERDPATAAGLGRAIAETDQADRIELAGELADSKLDEAFARADLFVSTALYEGFGMALSEAVAAGLPVLVARGGAVGEAVPESAALFFQPGDSAGLAGLIRGLLEDPVAFDRLREGARRAREHLPGWDRTARIVAEALLVEARP